MKKCPVQNCPYPHHKDGTSMPVSLTKKEAREGEINYLLNILYKYWRLKGEKPAECHRQVEISRELLK